MATYQCRQASHAGSWYSSSSKALSKELENWLKGATSVLAKTEGFQDQRSSGAKAVIAPHAGYSYSGETAAYAYSLVNWDNVERVFLLGPSHHVYIENCAFSAAQEYETPIGNITVDQEFIAAHRSVEVGGQKIEFDMMSRKTDEDEHSLEMHLPYIVKSHDLQTKKPFKLVPVLVGNLDEQGEAVYGAFFSQFLNDPGTLFVISSDFCHWGSRFGFTHHHPKDAPIYASIESLDLEAIRLIEAQDHAGYCKYLRTTRNTICGRHPIGVLLSMLNACKDLSYKIELKRYTQSSKVKNSTQSSVSYASIVVTPE